MLCECNWNEPMPACIVPLIDGQMPSSLVCNLLAFYDNWTHDKGAIHEMEMECIVCIGEYMAWPQFQINSKFVPDLLLNYLVPVAHFYLWHLTSFSSDSAHQTL